VGADTEVRSNARVIAATHRNLREMVAAGRFREDLYYRLFALRIRTPPLREHPTDIPALAALLWDRLTGAAAPPLPATVHNELQSHPWPGNVRELRAFLINLSVYADGRPVTAPLVRELMADRRGDRS
jgi:transcriptional regulator with PAS, ATPase and Fis domain